MIEGNLALKLDNIKSEIMSKNSHCKSIKFKSVLFISMLVYTIVCFVLGALGKNPFYSILYNNTSILVFLLILAISNLLIHYIIKRKFAYIIKKNPDVEYYHIVWHIVFLGYVVAWLSKSMSSAVLAHASLIIFAIPIAILIWEFFCRFIRKQIENKAIDKKEEKPSSYSSNIKSLSSKRWSNSFMTIMVISTLIMPIVGIIIGIHGIAEVWGNRKQGKILLIMGSILTVIYISLFFLFFFRG